MRNLKYLRKLSILMVSRYLGEHSRTNCVEKKFIEAFKYQKYTKFNKICPKMTISYFCCIGRKILKQKRLSTR